MSKNANDIAELQEWCWAQHAGELSPEGAARIGDLVTGNPAACDYYLRYMGLCAHIEWAATRCDRERADFSNSAPTDPEPAPFASEPPRQSDKATKKTPVRMTMPVIVPVPDNFGDTRHGLMAYVPQDWLFAYLVATVTFAIGLPIAYLIPVSSRPPIVERTFVATPPVDPKMEFVANITGMINCRWADRNTAPVGCVAVPVGRKYALASGLMEITYDTGAKVILQGPCTYQVESREGGYLSVGKLTARVEKGPRPKAQGPRSKDGGSG